VLPVLAALRCSIVVAVHRRYLAEDGTQADIDRVLETVIELPALRDRTASPPCWRRVCTPTDPTTLPPSQG